MAKILIADDEVKLVRLLKLELEHEGYETAAAHDGAAALEAALSGEYDLILLDLMMPVMSGIEVCRKLRAQRVATPVIMLTAKDDVSDKVAGLDTGADDYVTKPFATEELLARIRAALKRGGQQSAAHNVIDCGALRIDKDSRTASFNGCDLNLTKKEFDLLTCLVENENIVLTRNQLLDRVWGYEFAGDTNIVDVYVRYLRNKLDLRFDVRYIGTVRGVGYCFKRQ